MRVNSISISNIAGRNLIQQKSYSSKYSVQDPKASDNCTNISFKGKKGFIKGALFGGAIGAIMTAASGGFLSPIAIIVTSAIIESKREDENNKK